MSLHRKEHKVIKSYLTFIMQKHKAIKDIMYILQIIGE